MPKILITGSSGQIGANLGIELQRRGCEVVGVDSRPDPWGTSLPMHVLDLRDARSVERIVELSPFEAVVHLAANAKVYELVEQPRRALDNITVLFNALEAARQLEAAFIFGSSREVYGDIHRHVTHEGEADHVAAESPYSASKIAGEAMVYSYWRCYKLPFLVFRFSNVYGRFDNDRERMERVIPLFIERIVAGKEIVVYGKEKTLDFTYIDDCVAGIAAGLEKLLDAKVRAETFNLAAGKGHTLIEMAELIGKELGKDPIVRIEDSRPGEVVRYVADISLARLLLDYQPKIDLPEGIARTLAWWRDSGRL